MAGNLPYRNNVSCILFKNDKFLVVQLTDWKENWWKFPQGGVDEDETEEEAIKRELFEELNITSFKIIAKSRCTNKYDWPPELQLKKGSKWRGQFQKFYLVEFTGYESEIRNNPEEVRKYKWITKDEILSTISEMAALSGDYKNVITKTLQELKTNAKDFLGKGVEVIIDRPLGSKHPKHGFIYEVNYGYIPNTKSPDGEELDAYYLGVNEPLEKAKGVCIAIIHRTDDDDDKLIVVKKGRTLSDSEIEKQVEFQEKWFKHEIIRR